jgi:beta-mannosidase
MKQGLCRCHRPHGACNQLLLWWMVLLSGLTSVSGQNGQQRWTLASGWTFAAEGYDNYLPAYVPGSIHLDLLTQGRIPDPLYRNHAFEMGWVDSMSWVYKLHMPWPEGVSSANKVHLVFEGLDTYAEVFINGDRVLVADNMFRTWRIDLSGLDRSQDMDLRVVFAPAILQGAQRARRSGIRYPADSDPYDWKPSVHTRKAAYQFGWDFAPSLPGCGIWRPVYLEWGGGPVLRDVWLETCTIAGDYADVILHGGVEGQRVGEDLRIQWQIGEALRGEIILESVGEDTGFQIPVRIPDPRLWWPRGYGEAHVYPVVVRQTGSDEAEEVRFRAGIRTVTLDQSSDAWGTSFRFLVNGRPVFAKGANWVPADMFPARVDAERYRSLLGMAADAHMNMLRVWGGGIYEAPLFYELADSLGILVWQDFMFAGTMYPGDRAFLENVAMEVREQIRRLRRHPCLALWCGNNEIAVAWKHWGWQATYGYSDTVQRRLEGDYQKLFELLIPGLLDEEFPGSSYIPSSPVSNWGDPAELAHGSNHFWGVWHGEMPLDSLRTRVPRFMAEYGMQSFPSWNSIERFSRMEDWSDTSAVMKGRQRSYKGNGLLRRYIAMEGMPAPADFRALVAATHEVQARALDIAIRAHLGARPFCMGTLLWQFNEPWPGLSWSVIDYYGHKKPAYEVVRRAYALDSVGD